MDNKNNSVFGNLKKYTGGYGVLLDDKIPKDRLDAFSKAYKKGFDFYRESQGDVQNAKKVIVLLDSNNLSGKIYACAQREDGEWEYAICQNMGALERSLGLHFDDTIQFENGYNNTSEYIENQKNKKNKKSND